MSSEKNDENAPADIAAAIEQAEVMPDFLPPPERPVPPENPGPHAAPISAAPVKRQG